MSELSVSIAGIFVQPDVRRKRVTVTVEGNGADVVQLSVEGAANPIAGPPGRFVIDLPGADTWSPESPVLYAIACSQVGADESRPPLSLTFGMRELTVKDGRFYLNNRPYFVKGAVHDTGTLTAAKLTAAKAAGFTLVRVRVADLTGELLTHADTLGLLIYADWNDQAADEDLFLQYRNHPSLAMWRAPRESAAQLQAWDPSRLIFFQDSGATRLVRPYKTGDETCDVITAPPAAPVDGYAIQYMENAGEPETVTVVERIAATSDAAWMEDFSAGFEARDLARVFGDESAFKEAGRAVLARARGTQIESFRANNKISGYWYATMEDGEASEVRAAQSSLHPIIHMARTNLSPRQEAPVTVLLANDERTETRADLSLQVIGPTNQVLWKKRRNIKLPKHGRELWSGTIAASGATGPHQFVVRLLAGGKRLAESAHEFHVFEPVTPYDGEIHLLDPQSTWTSRCRRLAKLATIQAPIHVIPPIANTIRAYPDNDLGQILGQVKEGAVALFFSPPDDWNDLAELIDPNISATSVDAVAGLHYGKLHPVFDALPARGFLGRPYRNVVPNNTFTEGGEQDICGTFLPQATTPIWGSGILVRRYGSGRIVFTHLRVMDHLGDDPLADRLFVNFLHHFARRSVPSDGMLPVHVQSVEWLRRERSEQVRRWLLIGPFPNWSGTGHATAYPPEKELAFDAAYPGWYKALTWVQWHSLALDRHGIDTAAVCNPPAITQCGGGRGTYYAYAEFNADRRSPVKAKLEVNGAAKVWVNGNLIWEHTGEVEQLLEETVPAFFKQGRNTLLIKLSNKHLPATFRFNYVLPPEPMQVTWWR